MCTSRTLTAILVAWATAAGSPTSANDRATEFGLAVGKKMPFHVVDFSVGKDKDHCGCPSVMMANGNSRGVIIWTRASADAALRLAGALDKQALVDPKVQGYLVTFGAADLKEKAKGLDHVSVGASRHSAREAWDNRGVDPKSTVLVYFLDRKDIKAMWSFLDGELSDDKVKDLVGQARKFMSSAAP